MLIFCRQTSGSFPGRDPRVGTSTRSPEVLHPFRAGNKLGGSIPRHYRRLDCLRHLKAEARPPRFLTGRGTGRGWDLRSFLLFAGLDVSPVSLPSFSWSYKRVPCVTSEGGSYLPSIRSLAGGFADPHTTRRVAVTFRR